MRRTPLESIRAYCVACVGSPYQVDQCGGANLLNSSLIRGHICQFFQFRKGKGRPKLRIMRNFCLDCMGGSCSLVRKCPSEQCPIWPYRMGKNPKRAGIGGIGFKKLCVS